MNQKENQSPANILDQSKDENPIRQVHESDQNAPHQRSRPEKREDLIDKMVRAATAAILSVLGGGVAAGFAEQFAGIEIEFGSNLFYLIPFPISLVLFMVIWKLLRNVGRT